MDKKQKIGVTLYQEWSDSSIENSIQTIENLLVLLQKIIATSIFVTIFLYLFSKNNIHRKQIIQS